MEMKLELIVNGQKHALNKIQVFSNIPNEMCFGWREEGTRMQQVCRNVAWNGFQI